MSTSKYDNHPKIVAARAEFEREIRKLVRELEIVDTLPEQLKPFVSLTFVHKDETWVELTRLKKGSTYEKDPFKIKDVLKLLEGVTTIPTEATSGTFTSVHAKGVEPPDKNDKHKFADAGITEFAFSVRVDIHDETKLEVYTKVGETRVRLSFCLGRIGYKLRKTNSYEERGVRVVRSTKAIPVNGSKSITWSGGGSNQFPREVTALVYDVISFNNAIYG